MPMLPPRVAHCTLVAALLAVALSWSAPGLIAQDAEVIPQARPVLVWLSAVKSGNQDQLKTAFSAAMQRQFEERGWGNVLMIYQEAFQKAFGDYAVADFSFEFAGGEDRGHVNIMHRGNKWPAVLVIRESTGWKVNER